MWRCIRAGILTELNSILAAEECEVIIGLSQLYPLFLTSAGHLTSADATLFAILHEAGVYELTFVLTTVRYGEYPPFAGFAVDTQYALTSVEEGYKEVRLFVPQCAYSDVTFKDPEDFDGYGRIRHGVGRYMGVERESVMYLMTGLQVNKRK